MIVILGSTASDDASEFACDFAVVKLTPEAAQKIMGRMDALIMLYSRDRFLHEFHVWDAEIRFFQRELGNGQNERGPSDASQFVVATASSAHAAPDRVRTHGYRGKRPRARSLLASEGEAFVSDDGNMYSTHVGARASRERRSHCGLRTVMPDRAYSVSTTTAPEVDDI